MIEFVESPTSTLKDVFLKSFWPWDGQNTSFVPFLLSEQVDELNCKE